AGWQIYMFLHSSRKPGPPDTIVPGGRHRLAVRGRLGLHEYNDAARRGNTKGWGGSGFPPRGTVGRVQSGATACAEFVVN
ncbi:MAG TPA: hypothetical protein VGM03_01970, partial [Phycisphaerae bacterium]